MGVNLKDIDFGTITPQCSDCGVMLCWGIDEIEYLQWKGFWDNWTCRDCNPNYKGAYQEYQQNNKPFGDVLEILKNQSDDQSMEKAGLPTAKGREENPNPSGC